jgi:hypothetical protein
VSPAARLAVCLYQRPGLRRAWKVSCALWFGSAWALVAAPTAAAAPLLPTVVPMMAGFGLYDDTGLDVGLLYISTVSPFEAAANAAAPQLQGLNLANPLSWVSALIAGGATAGSNVLGSGIMTLLAVLLIFVGGLGIWLLRVAISAPWMPWLVEHGAPFVSFLQAMVTDFYVIPIALLIAVAWGGWVGLTKGMGRGLGIIIGAVVVLLLFFLLLNQPLQVLMGPNGVVSLGQYLGWVFAQAVLNNGGLVSGNPGTQLDALIAELVTVVIRDPIELVNFGTVIDPIPGCAQLYNAAIMGGLIDGPLRAIGQCYPAGQAYAEQVGLGSAAWLFVLDLVEFGFTVVLVWVGVHVIIIVFRAFCNVMVLVVAVPVGIIPGPPRRFAKRQVVRGIVDGVEAFASIAGLAFIAVLLGFALSGDLPGANGPTSILGKLLLMLLIVVVGAYAYHRLLREFRERYSVFNDQVLKERRQREIDRDYFMFNWTGHTVRGAQRGFWADLAGIPSTNLGTGDVIYRNPVTAPAGPMAPGRLYRLLRRVGAAPAPPPAAPPAAPAPVYLVPPPPAPVPTPPPGTPPPIRPTPAPTPPPGTPPPTRPTPSPGRPPGAPAPAGTGAAGVGRVAGGAGVVEGAAAGGRTGALIGPEGAVAGALGGAAIGAATSAAGEVAKHVPGHEQQQPSGGQPPPPQRSGEPPAR